MADDDIRKITTEIGKDLHEGGEVLSSSLKKINEKFRGTIERLGKLNQPLAQIQADTIKGMESTYAGAMQARKISNLQVDIADFMEGNMSDIDIGLLEKLNAAFPDVDFTELKKATKRMDMSAEVIKNHTEQEAKLIGAKETLLSKQESQQKRLLSETEQYQVLLGQAAASREKSEALAIELSQTGEANVAARLEQENSYATELESKIEEVKTRSLESMEKRQAGEVEIADAAIESQQEILGFAQGKYDNEKELFEEQNQLIANLTEDMASDAGRLGQFSEGLETLTGFDLVGSLDTMVKSVDAVGQIFGKEDLFQSMMMGMQGWAGNAKKGIQKMMTSTSDFFSNTTKSVKDGLGTAGSFIKEKASDAGDFLGETMTKAGDGLKKMGGMIGKSAKAMGGALMRAGKAMFSAAKKLLIALGPMLVSAAIFVGGLLMTAASLLISALPFILIGALILAAAYGLYKGFMLMYEKVGWFQETIDVVVGYFKSITAAIGRIFGGFYDFFAGLFTGDFDRMFGGVKDMLGGLWDLIKAPFVAIGEFFKNVFDIDIWGILRNLAAKILPGWLVDRIFGAEEDAEVTEKLATDMEGKEVEVDKPKRQRWFGRRAEEEELSPAAEAVKRATEPETTQGMMQERDMMRDQAVEKGNLASTIDNQTLAWKSDNKQALQKMAMERGIDTEGQAYWDWMKELTAALRKEQETLNLMAEQKQLEIADQADYVASKATGRMEYDDVFEEEFPEMSAERIKSAKEMADEAKRAEEEKASVQLGIQNSQNNTNNMNQFNTPRPRTGDNDTADKTSKVTQT